jgi:transposase InsO family protein
MSWQEESLMSLRKEFVVLAQNQSLPFAELCRRFNISRKTGYKWLSRYQLDVTAPLCNRSRKPLRSPTRTAPRIEAQVIALRHQHPAWGGRKLSRVLKNDGVSNAPAPSTITHILRRNGLLHAPLTGEGGVYQRFEHPLPNHLWQMDFKGHFITDKGRCDPLTVLDDHSRFNIVLQALNRTTTETVKTKLINAYRCYGLPLRMNMDNGSPWGAPGAATHGLTALSVWMIRLGIRVSFSRPYHPQTNGKEERFHRTLKLEVLKGRHFSDLVQVQHHFDQWRGIYNHRRPHEGIGLQTPVERYHPSPRRMPEVLDVIEYSPDDEVVYVKHNGVVNNWRRKLKVSNSLLGLPIAFRPRPDKDGVYDMFFCHQRFGKIDLKHDNV